MLASYFLYLRSFIALDRTKVIIAAALVCAGAIVEGLVAFSLIPLLETVLDIRGSGLGERLAGQLGRTGIVGATSTTIVVCLLFAGLVFMRSVIAWLRTNRLAEVSQGFVRHWRVRLFGALDRADWQGTLDHRRHELQHVLTEDVGRIAQGADSTIRSTTGLVLIAAQLVVALALAPALAACFLAVATIGVALFSRKLLAGARTRGEVQVANARRLYSDLNDYLAGMKTAKVHPHRDFGARMERIADDMSGNVLDFMRLQANAQLGLQLASAAILFGLLALGIAVFDTPPANLIVFLAIILRIAPAAFALIGNAQGIANTMPAFENVRAMEASLQATGRDPEAGRGLAKRTPEGALGVKLERIGFRYRTADRALFDGLTLDFEPGTMTALIGATGIGKTTVLDLIAGLVQPDSGAIRARSANGAELSADLVGEAVSYATQAPVLFDASIRENLLWSGTEASDAQILRALTITDARDLVEALPHGLDTRVGESGMQLSGGERQRLFLAAMILRRPSLLLMDEATSAVDFRTEARILANLRALRDRMTIITVTHRPPDPAIFDRIIDLSDVPSA